MSTIPFKNQLQKMKQIIMQESTYTIEQQQYSTFMSQMRECLANGNISLFRTLLEQNTVYKYDFEAYFVQKYQMTPFHIACENCRVTVMECMLQNKICQINSTVHPNGATPIFLVVHNYIVNPNRTIIAFNLLIQYGADPLIRIAKKNGESILDYIERKGVKSETLDQVKQQFLQRKADQAIKCYQLLCQSKNNKITNLLNPYEKQRLIQYLKIEIMNNEQ